jgi:hypothetical protein
MVMRDAAPAGGHSRRRHASASPRHGRRPAPEEARKILRGAVEAAKGREGQLLEQLSWYGTEPNASDHPQPASSAVRVLPPHFNAHWSRQQEAGAKRKASLQAAVVAGGAAYAAQLRGGGQGLRAHAPMLPSSRLVHSTLDAALDDDAAGSEGTDERGRAERLATGNMTEVDEGALGVVGGRHGRRVQGVSNAAAMAVLRADRPARPSSAVVPRARQSLHARQSARNATAYGAVHGETPTRVTTLHVPYEIPSR